MTARQSSITRSDSVFAEYDARLKEIKSMNISEISFAIVEELLRGFELEKATLDSKKSSILSEATRGSLKDRYQMLIIPYEDIVRTYYQINTLSNDYLGMPFISDLGEIRGDLPLVLSRVSYQIDRINIFSKAHKQLLTERCNNQLYLISEKILCRALPAHFRDSINLINMTLDEPSLHTLPHLIIWRDTAQEKIEKIRNKLTIKLPDSIEREIVKIYEELIEKLKAIILLLRTYPIPEPWSSYCMTVGLKHMLEGNFKFIVKEELNEDMKPLALCESDYLPGLLTRDVYNTRLDRLNAESAAVKEKLLQEEDKWFTDLYEEIEASVNSAFSELPRLYKDRRTLEFLVDKNEDDDLLREIYYLLLRNIRHLCNNRIDIPSVSMDAENLPIRVAPPREERDVPIASGVDRGAAVGNQLVTPAALLVVKNSVIVADKCGHLVSRYRATDLISCGTHHRPPAESPASLTIFERLLYVCYSNELTQYSLSWGDNGLIDSMNFKHSIEILQACCIASNSNNVYLGTLKPSIIRINTDTFLIDREYHMNPIRHEDKNRYPWLQDNKVVDFCICLFTGSPAPLQMFSLKGDLIMRINVNEDIIGAYHFALFKNPVSQEVRIYIPDFWGNKIKVFNLAGELLETFWEKGFYLGSLIHPTGIFVQHSGYITVCDMKEENCLQRL